MTSAANDARLGSGKLTLHLGRNARATLEPASGDKFFSTSLGTVPFARAASGELAGLPVCSRRLRRFAAQRVQNQGGMAPDGG